MQMTLKQELYICKSIPPNWFE